MTTIRKSPVVKAVGLLRRNPTMSPQEFKDYWINVHAPMVKERLPGLVHYTGKFPLPGKPTPETPLAPYDGIVELGFESVEALQKALNGPKFSGQDRQKSSTTLIDLGNTEAFMMEEYIVEL